MESYNRKLFSLATILAVVTSLFVSNSEVEGAMGMITVYPWNNRLGASAYVQSNMRCVDLPKLWQKKVSSVNTHGSCVFLCEERGCGGLCLRVYPGSSSHNRLRDVGFDRKASSVMPCWSFGRTTKAPVQLESE